MPTWIRTFSGVRFHLPEPRQRDITLIDIAHGLAIAPRWGGQCKFRYPVLAHAIYVAEMLPDCLKFDGLMHDSSEAYMCDLPSPIKCMMPQYKEIEHCMMSAIAKKFRFHWTPPVLVKVADAVALEEERKHLFDCRVGTDVPRITNRAGLSEPSPEWDFSWWEGQTTENLKRIFITKFYEYRKLR